MNPLSELFICQPFHAVWVILVLAASGRLRLDPYPIFGPTPSSSYEKVRFLPNLSLLFELVPNNSISHDNRNIS
jgi:hypothetical protein